MDPFRPKEPDRLPHDAWQREWDRRNRGQIMDPSGDVGRREQPGLRKKIRMQRNKRAYCFVDPQVLADLGAPPDEIQALFDEVLGDRAIDAEGRVRLKLAVHPHMRRWCLYELHLDPERGEAGTLWKVVWICMEDPEEGKLPLDLQGDPYKAHFTGVIGDYKLPEKWEFEAIERTDRKKYGVDAVEDYYYQQDLAEEQAAEFAIRDFERAFCDYYANMVINEVNQLLRGNQKLQSYDTIALKTNRDRFHIEQRTGAQGTKYTYKERIKSRAELEASLIKLVAQIDLVPTAERAAVLARAAQIAPQNEAERGFSTGKRRSVEALRENAKELAVAKLAEQLRDDETKLRALQSQAQLEGG